MRSTVSATFGKTSKETSFDVSTTTKEYGEFVGTDAGPEGYIPSGEYVDETSDPLIICLRMYVGTDVFVPHLIVTYRCLDSPGLRLIGADVGTAAPPK